ncbi:MAG: PadR family transcriptional regulator [Gammaproteobacteria bacterium]|nr:PadR family transcriptional regulator [Gammaproteobacteria bacterium]
MGRQFLGEFEHHVLAALVHQGSNAYGMTVRQEIEERTSRTVSIGAVYTTLARLEEKGFVSSHEGEATPERGNRAKRYFKIEAPGLRALEESRRRLEGMWAGLRLPAGA